MNPPTSLTAILKQLLELAVMAKDEPGPKHRLAARARRANHLGSKRATQQCSALRQRLFLANATPPRSCVRQNAV